MKCQVFTVIKRRKGILTWQLGLIFCDNQQADVIDGYLQQKYQRRVTAVENCSDANCLLTAVLQDLVDVPPCYNANYLQW